MMAGGRPAASSASTSRASASTTRDGCRWRRCRAPKHILECDTVIFSVGQRAGLAFLPDDAGVGLTRQQTIAINPNTFAATRPGVFAAGDSVSGTAFVIEAVAAGHKAAESIHRYLRGEELEPKAQA